MKIEEKIEKYLNEEYFIKSIIIKDKGGKDHSLKLTRADRKLSAAVNVYIDGELWRIFPGEKVAMNSGKEYIQNITYDKRGNRIYPTYDKSGKKIFVTVPED